MLRYFLKRLLFLIPVLLGVSVVIFSIVHLAPGDPAEVMLGPSATQEDISTLREQLGLTKPLYVQYGIFLTNALKGDLGRSIKSNAPVIDEIMERFPATLTLAMLGMTFAIVIGLPLGILAALAEYMGGRIVQLLRPRRVFHTQFLGGADAHAAALNLYTHPAFLRI